ncbi:hypothetical protein M728_005741 (plasmid) [Ensifer sp. WSM1721]
MRICISGSTSPASKIELTYGSIWRNPRSQQIRGAFVNFSLTKKLLLADKNPRLLPVAELYRFRENYRH